MIEADLFTIIRDIIGHDALLTRETKAYDVKGWDSVSQVAIILAVEEKFAIRLRTREIDRLRNVGDFIDLIEEKKAVLF